MSEYRNRLKRRHEALPETHPSSDCVDQERRGLGAFALLA